MKSVLTDYFISPKTKKRGRGRPKGVKNKIKKKGNHLKKPKTQKSAVTKQKHLNGETVVIDLIEEDQRVRDALPIDLTQDKKKRINWNNPKYKYYVDRVCESWLKKCDLCSGPRESLNKFASR